MELLALVLEAKAQVPEEPVKVQEVDWTIAGVLIANVSNRIEVAALFSHSIPKIEPLMSEAETRLEDSNV